MKHGRVIYQGQTLAVTETADGEVCVVPQGLRPAPAYRPPADEIARDVETAHYLMAVSWSPQACRTGKDYPDADHQCRDNRFGLTLHGLWNNTGEGALEQYDPLRGGFVQV